MGFFEDLRELLHGVADRDRALVLAGDHVEELLEGGHLVHTNLRVLVAPLLLQRRARERRKMDGALKVVGLVVLEEGLHRRALPIKHRPSLPPMEDADNLLAPTGEGALGTREEDLALLCGVLLDRKGLEEHQQLLVVVEEVAVVELCALPPELALAEESRRLGARLALQVARGSRLGEDLPSNGE